MTANGAVQPYQQRYALDNSAANATAHHTALADLLDGFTQWRIANLGIDLTNARALEVGPGHGSIAHWLLTQMGPHGRVVALDLDPSHIPPHPRITPVAHDLTSPSGLPSEASWPFDLIHARLTLQHLPNRRQLLTHLARRLAPGGMLLVQDWAGRDRDVVLAAPTQAARDLYETYQRAASKVFDAAGLDRRWAKRLHLHFLEEGLVNVRTLVHEEYWTSGHPGLRLIMAVAQQLAPQLMQHGFTGSQLGRLLELLLDPSLMVRGHPLYSVSARRPA